MIIPFVIGLVIGFLFEFIGLWAHGDTKLLPSYIMLSNALGFSLTTILLVFLTSLVIYYLIYKYIIYKGKDFHYGWVKREDIVIGDIIYPAMVVIQNLKELRYRKYVLYQGIPLAGAFVVALCANIYILVLL